MKYLNKALLTTIILCGLAGCEVEVEEVKVPVSEPSTTESEDEAEPPPIEVEAPNPDIAAPRSLFTVITDPWSKYFSAEPSLIVLPRLTEGIEDLLNEQQQKAREILSNTGQVADRPEYIQLEEALEALKSAVPGAETRSGYGRASRRYYASSPYSHVSASGDNAVVRTGVRGYYYSVFNKVHKSSSPALARSVENIIYNASLEDLDQRIEALRQLHRTWSRKTNVMSPNGVEGVMREANMAYLEGIQGYTGEVAQLQGRLKRVEALIDAEFAKKDARLEEWRAFEANRLPIIQEYIERQGTFRITPNEGNYELPTAMIQEHVILLACSIGERTLYFNLDPEAHAKHPFRLIMMGESSERP